jgi:ATP-dependent exoDNAse (exonuclease V) beta subunit
MKTSALPELDIQPLLEYDAAGLHPATKKTVVRAQAEAQRWADSWRSGERFRPLPGCPPSDKAAVYRALYRQAFEPLHAWLHQTALAFGRRVANAYERFRLGEATMTYDDQVRLALRVLQHPAAQRELAEERHSVLLDEAQDTDPLQFEVLRRVAGFHRDEAGSGQAVGQSLAIVGDFQQAIYAPRSDLATYQRMHEEIRQGTRGETARLEVTFRCDTAVIEFVNRLFPSILDETDGQCGFENLRSHEGAGVGQVVRLECPDLTADDLDGTSKIKSSLLHRREAEYVAGRIQELGYAGLGARSWSQVAILCPRRKWLLDVRHALAALGLRVQLHSSDETARDRLPVAWLTALIWIAAHPEDSFEIAGVLREIFGVPDSDMAIFTGGDGEKLRLDRRDARVANHAADDTVASALSDLSEAFDGVNERPLGEAVGRMMEKIRFRERLRLIPSDDPEEVVRELDDLLALIAERVADGATLPELAQELRAGFSLPSATEEPIDENAIQMMTSHKAKGLEWDVVLVPYLHRRIEWKHHAYPRVVRLGAEDVIICRDKTEYDERARTAVEQRELQQYQRLYYVMFTRAKRSLVLFDDEVLMSRQKNRPGEIAGRWMPG